MPDPTRSCKVEECQRHALTHSEYCLKHLVVPRDERCTNISWNTQREREMGCPYPKVPGERTCATHRPIEVRVAQATAEQLQALEARLATVEAELAVMRLANRPKSQHEASMHMDVRPLTDEEHRDALCGPKVFRSGYKPKEKDA